MSLSPSVKGDEETTDPSVAKMNKMLLNSMSRRRRSCPQAVQQLWDAVKVIRYQRQVSNLERIVKYMHRVHSMSEEDVTQQLGYCVRDGLLMITKRKGSKGSKLGVEQEGYKLPDTMDASDKHDWYCSQCHIGGDVICCGGCWRVYHVSCIDNMKETKHKFLCSICQSCESEETLSIKQKRLNKLLCMACTSLKDRYSFLVNSTEMLQRSINIGSPGAQIDIGSECWRTKYLISEPMDIARMASKARNREYTHLSQFTADVHTIVHNVVIFHGVHSNMADNARQMLRDCTSEVDQMRACHMCYEASVAKPTRHWFCLPCKPQHMLVYAKAKGYSYWPAKVIKVEGDKYEVRFFGGAHCRAIVDKSSIQPISTNTNTLQVKHSPSWSKACEELKRHQEMLSKDVALDSSSSSDSDDGSTISHRTNNKKTPSTIVGIGKKKNAKKKTTNENSVESSGGEEDGDGSSGDEVTIVPPSSKKRQPVSRQKEENEEEVAEDDVEEEGEAPEEDEPSKKKKRGRGRRPKTPIKSPPVATLPLVKRKRGRPPLKKKLEAVIEEEEEASTTPTIKTEEDESNSATSTPTTTSSRSQRGGSKSTSALGKRTPAKRPKVEVVQEVEEEKNTEVVADSIKKEDGDEQDDDEDEEDKEEDEEEEENPLEEKKRQEKLQQLRRSCGGSNAGNVVSRAVTAMVDETRPQSPTTSSSSVAKSPEPKKNEEEIVSSSCMEPQFKCSASTQTKHSDSKKANKEVINKLKTEIEHLKTTHAEQIKRLQQSHLQEIASTKKKQWCYNCELEAIYHCCWNTAYCSTECQQVHWQSEHKRVCRRKR